FTEAGLIDDAVFARAWVESRHHSRGLSRGMLAVELARRGVGAADVRTAVASLPPEQEIETARRLVAKRAAATRGRPLPTRIRQLVGLLARKVYSASLAYRLVREVLEQEETDPDGDGMDLAVLADLDAAAALDAEAARRRGATGRCQMTRRHSTARRRGTARRRRAAGPPWNRARADRTRALGTRSAGRSPDRGRAHPDPRDRGPLRGGQRRGCAAQV